MPFTVWMNVHNKRSSMHARFNRERGVFQCNWAECVHTYGYIHMCTYIWVHVKRREGDISDHWSLSPSPMFICLHYCTRLHSGHYPFPLNACIECPNFYQCQSMFAVLVLLKIAFISAHIKLKSINTMPIEYSTTWTYLCIFSLSWCVSEDDGLLVCGSLDQTISFCRLVGEEEGGDQAMVLLHQCKGHSHSVEDLDVCHDRSKVRREGVVTSRLTIQYSNILFAMQAA